MLPPDSSFPYWMGHIQVFRCITDLYCQDVTGSCLPHSQMLPTITGVEEFHAVCLFHGVISHRVIIYSEGATLTVSPQHTSNERRFVDAKTVMIVFIITRAGATDMNHFFFVADWKMLCPLWFCWMSIKCVSSMWPYFNLHPWLKGIEKMHGRKIVPG